MKTNFVKCIALLIMFISYTAAAQQKTAPRKSTTTSRIVNIDGHGKETVNTVVDNTEYKMEMLNEKITALYADGKLVPPGEYSKYGKVITEIKEQLRLDKIQAKKDQAQAMEDQKQARLDQQQALRDQKQAKLDQEHAMKDQQQAKLDYEHAEKNQQEAKLEQEHAEKEQKEAKIEQENAEKDQVEAKLEQERAMKDQEEAKRNQEEALKDQAAAKIDEEKAKEEQRQVKLLIADLIKDGIIPNEKSLFSIKISSAEMIVNDKKQPEEVYTKYKTKYPRFATGNFSFSNNSNGSRMIHMNR